MKILFVACYSPLINNSASIETLWYLNKLAELEDNEIHLLTVNFPSNSIYYDADVLSLLNKKVKVHAIDGGKIFNFVVPKKGNKENRNNKVNEKKHGVKIIAILKKIKAIVAIPDAYITWAFKAYRYANRLMESVKFDVIFSMHEPPSSHICAYLIKKQHKDIPWITYWSDPWMKDSTRENHNNLRRKLEGHLERNIIKSSEKYVFVTEANRWDYINTYNLGRDKTYLINRGYDAAEYNKLLKEEAPMLISDNKVNVVYAGEIFSKLRDLNPFIEALDLLRSKDIEAYNNLNILFFGNIDDINIVNKLKEQSCVSVSPRIPYKEAVRYMLKSDVLLLLGNKNSKQIPAKIYDYFGTNSYVLVLLGDENDPIKPLVSHNSKCIVSENNSEVIYEKLLESIYKAKNDKEGCKPLVEYEWGNVAKKLNKIFEEVED